MVFTGLSPGPDRSGQEGSARQENWCRNPADTFLWQLEMGEGYEEQIHGFRLIAPEQECE